MDVIAVQAGLRASASAVGATVVGGDLSRSPGPLMIDVVALGRGGWPVRRMPMRKILPVSQSTTPVVAISRTRVPTRSNRGGSAAARFIITKGV